MAGYMGLAVGMYGDQSITAQAATETPLTLVAAASQSARILDVQNSAGTSYFGITKNGNPIFRLYTTLPTTGLTKGEMIFALAGSTPKIGMVYSTAANGIKLIKSRSKTLATATA